MESFELSRRDVYAMESRPTCKHHGNVAWTAAYQRAAVQDAALQLEKAGVRLALLLNRAVKAAHDTELALLPSRDR